MFESIYQSHHYLTRQRDQPVVARGKSNAANKSIRYSLPQIVSNTHQLIIEKVSTHSLTDLSIILRIVLSGNLIMHAPYTIVRKAAEQKQQSCFLISWTTPELNLVGYLIAHFLSLDLFGEVPPPSRLTGPYFGKLDQVLSLDRGNICAGPSW